MIMQYILNILLAGFLIFYGLLTEIQIPFGKSDKLFVKSEVMELAGDTFINFLGSNANHHHTLKLIRDIKEPFSIILFDAHSDACVYKEKLKCGNWVNFAAEELPNLQQIIALGISQGLQFEDTGLWNNYELIKSGRLLLFPPLKCQSYLKDDVVPEVVKQYVFDYRFDRLAGFFGKPGYYVIWNTYKHFAETFEGRNINLYFSIDLDVMKDVKTPYGSGLLTVEELISAINLLKENNNVIGVDVCGTDDKSSEYVVGELLKCFHNR